MSSDDRFLEERHAAWSIPPEVLADAVRRASGSDVIRRTRIVAGEANEVWDVTTSSGVDLIVRISHWDTFGAEAWAVRQCRRIGVPVPDVLLVEDGVAVGDGQAVAVWIHRKIDGRTLQEAGRHEEVRALTVRAGELLAMAHSVPTSGFGWLDEHGQAASATWLEWVTWDEASKRAGVDAGLASSDVDEVDRWLETYRDILAATQSRLLHGDWGAVHVLVRDERVVALIDFGSAHAGNCAFDFARWDLVFNVPQHPSADIIEGYQHVSDPGPLLDVRRALSVLAHVRYLAPYFAKDGRSAPLALMNYRFSEALAELRRSA